MSKLKSMIGIILIFGMGVLVGGIGVHIVERKILTEAFRGTGNLSSFLVNRISRRLDLDSDQKLKLTKIIQASREKMKAIRIETTPKLQLIFQEAEKDILQFLTPKQQIKFEKLVEKRKVFLKKMMEESPQ